MKCAVNQMKIANAIAWAISVMLMFIAPPDSLVQTARALALDDGQQWVAEREQHREPHADDERGVDQAEEQEHLAL